MLSIITVTIILQKQINEIATLYVEKNNDSIEGSSRSIQFPIRSGNSVVNELIRNINIILLWNNRIKKLSLH